MIHRTTLDVTRGVTLCAFRAPKKLEIEALREREMRCSVTGGISDRNYSEEVSLKDSAVVYGCRWLKPRFLSPTAPVGLTKHRNMKSLGCAILHTPST